jgi:hypothetical protein
MDQEKLQVGNELSKWKRELYDKVNANLRLMQPETQELCQQGLLDIVDQAVKLDKEFSRQASQVYWTFGDVDGTPFSFPQNVEVKEGERFTKSTQRVALVISPGVMKQGKFTGEGFDSTTRLLEMESSCRASKPRV